MSSKRFTHQQEVRFADIDVMGHVNNAIYLNYFEQARMYWFKNTIGDNWDWHSNGIILAHNEVNYRLPIYLHDKIFIDVWCTNVGTKSVEMNYEIYVLKEEKKIIKSDGMSVFVCFDFTKKQTIPVPEEWKKILI